MRDVNAEFISETARIDLNAAPKELLAGLFAALGAPRSAGRLLRRPHHRLAQRRPRAGDRRTRAAHLSRRRPALRRRAARRSRTSAELGLVHGIPEVMVERALPFLTVYSGQPQINIFDAAPQVLAALPGMDPGALNAILVQRAGRRPAERRSSCWRCSVPPRHSRHARQQGAAGDRPHRVRQRAAHDDRSRDLHTRRRHRAVSRPDLARRYRRRARPTRQDRAR